MGRTVEKRKLLEEISPTELFDITFADPSFAACIHEKREDFNVEIASWVDGDNESPRSLSNNILRTRMIRFSAAIRGVPSIVTTILGERTDCVNKETQFDCPVEDGERIHVHSSTTMSGIPYASSFVNEQDFWFFSRGGSSSGTEIVLEAHVEFSAWIPGSSYIEGSVEHAVEKSFEMWLSLAESRYFDWRTKRKERCLPSPMAFPSQTNVIEPSSPGDKEEFDDVFFDTPTDTSIRPESPGPGDQRVKIPLSLGEGTRLFAPSEICIDVRHLLQTVSVLQHRTSALQTFVDELQEKLSQSDRCPSPSSRWMSWVGGGLVGVALSAALFFGLLFRRRPY